MRALVVSNMWPTADRPALGTFVKDQVDALRRRRDIELEVVTFPPGGAHYAMAVPGLLRRRGFDAVHAHFGLTAVPALAAGGQIHGVTLHGNDLVAARSRKMTLAVLPRYDVVGIPSQLARDTMLPAEVASRASVLPCGIDLRTFQAIDRREARAELGLDPGRPLAVFPFDPNRSVKRYDLAKIAAGEHQLRALGHESRDRMRLWLSAASVVLCPSTWETFGTAAVEAIACGTAVIGTPTGAHSEVLGGVPWSVCAPFETERWRAFVDHAISDDAQHPDGAVYAEPWSSDAMAERLVGAWASAMAAPRHGRR